MSFYLLANANPNGSNFYTARKSPVLAVVMHVTAGLQDQGYVGEDVSAEKTAKYAATTDRQVSWHSASDSDSNFELLPDSYTAFHVQGYNSSTIGHEISKKDTVWSDEPKRWVEDTLNQTAKSLRPRMKTLGIPFRNATKAELDRAIATGGKPVGIVDHQELDPDRRSDPGRDFPWARFLEILKDEPSVAPASNPLTASHNHKMPLIQFGSSGDAVKDLQGHLVAWRRNRELSEHARDGVFDEWTHIATASFQKWYGMKPDGIVGDVTWSKLHSITKGARVWP